MFAFLEGKIDFISPALVYLNVNGVGYEIQITVNTFDKIQQKKECRLYTHLQIREDAWVLHGFATEAERDSFRSLISVSGIGGATARILLSSFTSQDLYEAVESENINLLKSVKGIGTKTAQRIILELKGKLDGNSTENNELTGFKHNTMDKDALSALVGLGIAKSPAAAALAKAKTKFGDQVFTVEDWIKAALKCL